MARPLHDRRHHRQPITIYGDGKQVRDVLFVEDLVTAFRLAAERIDVTAGQVYNIGGGPANALAVWIEFAPIVATSLYGRRSTSDSATGGREISAAM